MLNPREFKLVAGEDPAVNNFTLNGRERHCLFVNGGGQRFIEGGYALGIDNDLEGRGVAIGDLDQDGALDIVVRSAARQRLTYYHNEVGARAHFLRVELQGTRSNRDAIGTVARLRGNGMTQSRLKMAGNGFQGQSEGTLHFGLGAATHAEELVIQWPSGRVQRFGKPPVDHVVRVVEGSDKLTARRLPNWRPSAAAPPVPEAWSAKRVDGQVWKLTPGRPAVVAIWASWCKGCREEVSVLNPLSARLRKVVDFVGISFDERDPKATKRFLDSTHPRIPSRWPLARAWSQCCARPSAMAPCRCRRRCSSTATASWFGPSPAR